jgi:ABC-type branched-subunit amino acid transport system permease subunit
MNNNLNWAKAAPLLLIAALIAFPLAMSNEYVLLIATLIGIYVIVNSGLDIVYGYSGQITLGQAGFYAIGAYTSAILSLHTGVPVIFCMIAGGLLSSFLGMIIAIPSVKLVHHFLAMVTIGFGEIVRLLAVNGGALTAQPMAYLSFPSSRSAASSSRPFIPTIISCWRRLSYSSSPSRISWGRASGGRSAPFATMPPPPPLLASMSIE